MRVKMNRTDLEILIKCDKRIKDLETLLDNIKNEHRLTIYRGKQDYDVNDGDYAYTTIVSTLTVELANLREHFKSL